MADPDGQGVDERLYSRQLFVMGREAQERLQRCHVLMIGRLDGLAAEIAKNIMLAGVHALSLSDDSPCCVRDLSANFFLSEEDVTAGRLRAEALLASLAELNHHVALDTVPESAISPDRAGIGRFDVVVLVNAGRARALSLSASCRELKVCFCATGLFGLYGYLFNDFGETFTILDVDGETPKRGVVVDVQNDPSLAVEVKDCRAVNKRRVVVYTADDKHHGLKDGDLVTFSGVRGVEQLNGLKPLRVLLVSVINSEGKQVEGQAFSVELPITSVEEENMTFEDTYGYEGGGHFSQVKEPQTMSFELFATSFNAVRPACVVNNWNDFDMPFKLHAFLAGLWEFAEEKQALPRPGSTEDAVRVVELSVAKLSLHGDNKDESLALSGKDMDLLKRLAYGAAGQLNPMAAYFGGIAAQEVLKACSGKFTPVHQWLHFAASECLPKAEVTTELLATATKEFPSLEVLESNYVGEDDNGNELRNAGQAVVFGWSFQQRLADLRCFLVGAGALGCESLKNFALMGVGCSKSGAVVVTDMDGIEISNLNRQFLFRPRHIGKMKSLVAAEMSRAMNPSFIVQAFEVKVAPETESMFDDAFWSSQDVIVNALDNVTARKYVDSKCLFHQRPLLESGTLGAKANTLPVVPHITESYGSDMVKDDGGEEIPACTLHAYPNLIEHTLQWARDAVFEKYFCADPREGADFMRHQRAGTLETRYMPELDRQPASKLTRLRSARAALLGIEPEDHPEKLFPYKVELCGAEKDGVDLPACVMMARMRFEELFVNKIKQLLHVHPLDKTVDENGTKFWSGKRHPPAVETFNTCDPLHMQFLCSATFLYTQVYGVELGLPTNRAEWDGVLLSVLEALPALPEFHVDGKVVVPENEEQAKALKEAEDKRLEEEMADSAERCDEEFDKLIKWTGSNIKAPIPQQFEKDDENSNGHMDLIFSAASIRARLYGIPLVSQLQAKMIVERIIPAIATVTAMTTGAVALELYKLVHNHGIESFRATNINLAVNSYTAFEPNPCAKLYFGKKAQIKKLLAGDTEAKALPVSIWTMVDLTGDMTVQEVLDYFLENYEFEVTAISSTGDVSLYNDMFGQEDRLGQTLSELYRAVINAEPPRYILLNIDGDYDEEGDADDDDADDEEEDDDEEDIVVPTCRLCWQ